MGTRADEAALRVTEQRAHITRMLEDLEQRVQDDVEGARGALSDRVNGLEERASAVKDRVPGSDALTEQVTLHPLMSVLGGFGTGIALGIASASIGNGEGGPETSPHKARSEAKRGSGGQSRIADLLSSTAMGMVTGPLREEFQTLIRQAARGFLGTDEVRGETPTPPTPPRAPNDLHARRNGHEPAETVGAR